MAPPRQCFPGQARLSLLSCTCSTRPCPPGTPPAHSSPRPSPDEALSQPAGSTSPSRGPALPFSALRGSLGPPTPRGHCLGPPPFLGSQVTSQALPFWAAQLQGLQPSPGLSSQDLRRGHGSPAPCAHPRSARLPPLGHRLSPATCPHLFHHLSPGLLPPAHPQAVPHSSRALT